MPKKLWFISEDSDLISVFDDQEIAREELFYLREDDPISTYKIYGLTVSDLENYPDEYELALSEGFIAFEKTSVKK